jgi:hypothetical protein
MDQLIFEEVQGHPATASSRAFAAGALRATDFPPRIDLHWPAGPAKEELLLSDAGHAAVARKLRQRIGAE